MFSKITFLHCSLVFFLLLTVIEWPLLVSSKSSSPVIDNLVDAKDLKKLLRTKNNILVCYVNSLKKTSGIVKVFRETADLIKGQGTMVLIDCAGEAKKMCKKMRITPEPYALKHYKDGDFHKDYDRKETVSSMLNFMRDPAGSIPWEEDETVADIHHLTDIPSMIKLVKKQSPVMVMFYAPWCGFCKQLKPEYASAASELSGRAVLAALDANRPENSAVRSQFNITGFPTILYFENGVNKMTYEGEYKKQALVDFMRDPSAVPVKPKEEIWSETDNDVLHLTDENFAETLAEIDSALVMFYAPWCGHCKRMKPEYEKTAAILKEKGERGVLAAVDATKEREIGKKYAVKGYPTIKYFKNGDYQYDVSVRDEAKILEFMRDPKEPPPPPPPEAPWSEQVSEVFHLGVEDFKSVLKKKKHALVMFYAPWCGHCKKAKPEFTDAAERLKEDPRVAMAAVDCTVHSTLCSTYQVSGYPTLKYFQYFNKEPPKDYTGGRMASDFLKFMAPFTTVNLGDIKAYSTSTAQNADDWKPQFVEILNSDNFDSILTAEKSLLVLFYAPWCGHCVKFKEPYAEAAKLMAAEKIPGKLAAIDLAAYASVGERFSISGFPTVKYFRSGKLITTYNAARTSAAVFEFMKNPPTKPVETKSKDEL